MLFSKLFASKQAPHHSSTIEFNGLTIALSRKAIKTLRLKVHPHTGAVSMSVPKLARQQDINNFLEQNANWLSQQRSRIEHNDKDHTVAVNSLPLWGEQYQVTEVQNSGKSELVFNKESGFTFFNVSPSSRVDKVEQFYRIELMDALSQWQSYWPDKLNVAPSFIGIRKMHTKWGSCNISRRRVWLALELVKYPKSCAEMVFIHELVHLLEHHHTARFYQLMSHFMPDWQDWDNILRKG